MKTNLLILMLAVSGFASTGPAWAMDSDAESCWKIAKSMHFVDGRDGALRQCMETFTTKKTLQALDCKQIADSMYYADDRDRARSYCINNGYVKPSVSDCNTIAKSMFFADNKDIARSQCINKNIDRITVSECRDIADSFYYADGRDAARLQCMSVITRTGGSEPQRVPASSKPSGAMRFNCEVTMTRSPASDLAKSVGAHGKSEKVTASCTAVSENSSAKRGDLEIAAAAAAETAKAGRAK